MTAAATGAALRDGRLDPVELVQSCLARIAAADPAIFTVTLPERALAEARAARERLRAGLALGPLDGVPVAWKDLFDLSGRVTTAGSAVLRGDAPASADAALVAAAARAGMVTLGCLNMTEFAYSGIGLNPHYGTPGNARDPARIPGGSSSGAGVTVAEGTSAISIGSDTGGSIRIPAALNGVVGFKPTMKRIAMGGVFPLSPSLDSIGPLARTVAECADADAVLAGEAPQALPRLALSGLKIGVPRGHLLSGTEPDVEKAFEAALDLLRRNGATVADVDLEDLLARMREATRPASIASIEATEIHADWLLRKAAGVDPRVSGALLECMAVPAWAYLRLMRRRGELARAMDEAARPFDMLALPTVPVVAPLMEPLVHSDTLFNAADTILLRNPEVVNQFDMTAISLPMPDMALPAGLMLVARHGHDRRLLEMAAAVEAAFS